MNEWRLRKVDIGTIINLFIFFGLIYAFFKHPSHWDIAYDDVVELKPRVSILENRASAYDAHQQDINHRLDILDQKMDILLARK